MLNPLPSLFPLFIGAASKLACVFTLGSGSELGSGSDLGSELGSGSDLGSELGSGLDSESAKLACRNE